MLQTICSERAGADVCPWVQVQVISSLAIAGLQRGHLFVIPRWKLAALQCEAAQSECFLPSGDGLHRSRPCHFWALAKAPEGAVQAEEGSGCAELSHLLQGGEPPAPPFLQDQGGLFLQ